jgi:trehalose synthase
MIGQTADLWWKHAVIYCLDPETFLDSDGDGSGDLPGVTDRIDYLAGIGVTCLWLMPIYPSPNRDDGYDVVDHYGVDPHLGTPGDVVDLVRAARERGIRVIADLVVNHTSDQHPWFRQARASRDSPHRDFYVWADERPEDSKDMRPVFPDAESSVWTYDRKAGQYFLHHFYRHQPDLNVANPQVRDAIAKIAGYWLELGLSGFRIDAVPFLIETHGLSAGGLGDDPHAVLRDLRAYAGRRRGDHVLLGEVNLPPKQLRDYVGGDRADELQMLFAFTVNQAMYLAFAREEAAPLARALEELPPLPDACQWAQFVRNHDELTLDKLSDEERAEVFAAFGPDPGMQLFGRGLRRRLPPMVGNDAERIHLAYSLLFSLPGTPVLFYGEEIGMAENLAIPGRMSVRSPMQWSGDEPNGGFSAADPSALRRPVVDDPQCGPQAVNAADQARDPDSLLNWMERVIRARRDCPEIGWGAWKVLEAGHPALLAIRYDWEGRTLIALHNLAGERAAGEIDAEGLDARSLRELLGRGDHRPRPGGRLEVTLPRYGYRWLRASRG